MAPSARRAPAVAAALGLLLLVAAAPGAYAGAWNCASCAHQPRGLLPVSETTSRASNRCFTGNGWTCSDEQCLHKPRRFLKELA